MAEIWKPKDPDLIISWWEAIVDEAQDELTPWELEFITSIEIRVRNKWQLSEKQEKTLERIYAEKTD